MGGSTTRTAAVRLCPSCFFRAYRSTSCDWADPELFRFSAEIIARALRLQTGSGSGRQSARESRVQVAREGVPSANGTVRYSYLPLPLPLPLLLPSSTSAATAHISLLLPLSSLCAFPSALVPSWCLLATATPIDVAIMSSFGMRQFAATSKVCYSGPRRRGHPRPPSPPTHNQSIHT